ncbi:MAG: hypothetical protein NDI61_06085 [Bdellovibrionaceae bacterium]|nr:hypothetical protein [Pseudobdellovibrionaceae bacterium]
MAATKPTPNRSAWVAVACIGIALLVAFQNCAVEVSEETPGAASACVPSADQLTEFNMALTSILQNSATLATGGKSACGQCHLTTSGNSASTRFGIVPDTDESGQTSNWCSASLRASRFLEGYLRDSHPGGTYSDSEVEALLTWAGTL